MRNNSNYTIHWKEFKASEAEKEEVKWIKRRQAFFEEERSYWEDDWKKIAEFVQPRREFYRTKEGFKQSTKQYDGTPANALYIQTSGTQGYLVSPQIEWFDLYLPYKELMEEKRVMEYIEGVKEQMYYSFSRTNFYDSMFEFIQDGGSIGTATIYSEEDLGTGKIIFSTRHPIEIFIAENRFGLVDTTHRKFELTAKEAVKFFDKERLPREIVEAADKNPDMKYEFIHAVYPNEDYKNNIHKSKMRFASVYIHEKSDHFMKEKSGYRLNPYAVWRWRKNSNEKYGRSPAHDALVDIETLNKISKDNTLASQLGVMPALNVPAELRGRLRVTPGGVNYYEDAQRLITPINLNINYQVGYERERDKREIIRKHFNVDFFLILAQTSDRMTATEIMERQGEKAVILGPMIGRLNSECLDPIIDRVFEIELEAGRLPQPPPELQDMGGHEIMVDYVSPLAMAQKKMFKVSNIIEGLRVLTQLAEIRPETMDHIDFDKMSRELVVSAGLPYKYLIEMNKVNEIRMARLEMLAKQAQMQKLGQMAEAVPKLSKRVEPGSIMEKVGERLPAEVTEGAEGTERA